MLAQLTRLKVTFPIMLQITPLIDGLPKKSHCSVLEFTAEDGNVHLPLWMMENLGLDPNGKNTVELKSVNLVKGTFVELQAHETGFTMLENSKVILQSVLRNYSALTVGDTITVHWGTKTYKFDVTDVEPKTMTEGKNVPDAICIVDTDLAVDFKEPRDYKEWANSQTEIDETTNTTRFVILLFGSSATDKLCKPEKILQASCDAKTDDEERQEEDKGWVLDVAKCSNDKWSYFQRLEQQGGKGIACRSHFIKRLPANSTCNVSKKRGTPLGLSIKSDTFNCRQKRSSVRKMEEMVGIMKYIFEVDESGHRKCVRRLFLRNNSSGQNLKD